MADLNPEVSKIPSTKNVKAIQNVEKHSEGTDTPSFKSYMQGKEPSNPSAPAEKTTKVTPFDLAQGKVLPPGPTYDTIQTQAKTAHTSMGELNQQLNTPKLKLKQSTKYLLNNKLNGANTDIHSASMKLGAEEVKDQEENASGPLAKYLNLVTSGQKQLELTQQQLQKIAASGEKMNPADMLLVQVKLNKAQQQLEFSSMLLGKSIDSLKQMMNTQL